MKKDKEEDIKYVWVSEGGDSTCDECSSLDGEEFDSLDDAPDKPHPNCKCEIKEVVASSYPNNPDDTISVKEALATLGYYRVPEWGITPYTEGAVYDGIRQFQKDNKLYVDGIMRPEGETVSQINEKLAGVANYLSSKGLDGLSEAGMQGLSLGWSDEINGVMGGLGYGVGSLSKDKNKAGESFTDAFKRGYVKYRDERRNLLEEGYKKNPTAMAVMESAGAIASPSGLLFRTAKAAPLSVKARRNLLESVATGGAYGVGTSKGDVKDYAKNVALGIGSSYGGYKIANKFFGRSNVFKRKDLLKQFTNVNLNNVANRSYKKYFEEDE